MNVAILIQWQISWFYDKKELTPCGEGSKTNMIKAYPRLFNVNLALYNI